MRSTALLVAAASISVGGLAYAATRSTDTPVPLLATGTAGEHEPSTTTEPRDEPADGTTSTSAVTEAPHDEPDHPVTTTTAAPHEEPAHPATTTTEHHEPERPTTTTVAPHEEPHPSTTTTTAPRPATGPIHLECTTAHTTEDLRVICEWGQVPERSASLVIMREQTGPSRPIDRIVDVTVHRYVDETTASGVSYAYRVSAYAEDGTFLGTSNPVRLTPGPAPEGA